MKGLLMELEALKQAMDAAKVAHLAAPDDEALKTAFETAKSAYDAALEAEPEDDFDESKADDRTKKYIAKLRKEAGSHRTKAKDLASKVKSEQDRVKAILKAAGIESEDEDPTTKLKEADQQKHALAFSNAVYKEAIKNGIGEDQLEFFEFMVAKAINELDEGEELPEEALMAIVNKCKKSGASKKANSSTNSATPPPGDNPDKISLEKFCLMTILEKSKLYESNKDLYAELYAQAKAKKKLV